MEPRSRLEQRSKTEYFKGVLAGFMAWVCWVRLGNFKFGLSLLQGSAVCMKERKEGSLELSSFNLYIVKANYVFVSIRRLHSNCMTRPI